jgi:type I restriction enzyme S subunit
MGGEYDGVLGDMADLIRGVSYRPDDLLPDGSAGVPLLRATNIGDRRLDLSDVLYVPRGHVRDTQRLRLFDVVIAMSSGSQQAVGRLAQLRQEWDGCVGAFCGVIRPKAESVYPEYLGYVLQSPAFRERIETYAVGTAIMNLSRERILGFPLTLPSTEIQKAIAHILGTLDDKIELNRQMNRTLEEMARAIFKSWFVDFDPVRAKAAVRRAHPSWTNEQVSRAACPNLKPEIAELFPDSFEDSKLGEIPRGWKVRPIGDVVQILGGGTPSTKEPAYWEGSIHPFCTPKDMASLTDPVLLQTERHLTDKGLAKVSSGQLPLGTVLLSSRAPIGYLAVAETPISINQGIIAMVCDGELPNLYVLHWTKSNMDRILTNANGSTFMEISKRNFRPIAAVVPSPEVLNDFMRVVEPMHRRVVSSLKQIRQLANLRDFLLPRLISGDLVVAEGERIVGRIST